MNQGLEFKMTTKSHLYYSVKLVKLIFINLLVAVADREALDTVAKLPLPPLKELRVTLNQRVSGAATMNL